MKKLKKFYDQRQLHWMVLPGVAFMIVFNYIPIYGIIIAFKIIRLLTRFLLHHGLDLKIFESLWKIVFGKQFVIP